MQVDIESKSKELKLFVSRYDSRQFLGELSTLMAQINPANPSSTLQDLSSPQKQMFHLAALNITSPERPGEVPEGQFTDSDWEQMKRLLQEIEEGYKQLFDPKPDEQQTEEWLNKRMIALAGFFDYFNQGLLNYDEQIIERVDCYFSKFNPQITDHYGLSAEDFISIYNWIDNLTNKFLMENINRKEGEPTWNASVDEMMKKGLMPWEWQDHLPERIKNLYEFMGDKGRMYRFTKSNLTQVFGEAKATAFLNIFTCERKETEYIYFTEQNPLFYQPLFKIDEETYQAFEMKYLIQAVYNVLTAYCLNNIEISGSFTKHRGNMLEDKAEHLFRDFLGPDVIVHKGYFTDKPGEQDLLILKSGAAFIIEPKANKRDEPRRDPDKAYTMLVQDFKAAIQKGYDQCYRVMKTFISKTTLPIFQDEKRKIKKVDIRTRNYHSAFSIVVTLERFAFMQMDLTGLLKIYDDDEFPWSVCVDELEMILLVMKREGKKTSDLVRFLTIRQKLQGRVACHDETDIAAVFILDGFSKEAIEGDDPIRLPPGSGDLFDDYYNHKGLGLVNEKNLAIKTSGKYLPIGG